MIEVSSPEHPSRYREGCYTLEPISSEGDLGLQLRAPAVCFAPQVFVGSTELVIELDAIEIPNNISVSSPLVFEHGAETVDMLPGFVDSLM